MRVVEAEAGTSEASALILTKHDKEGDVRGKPGPGLEAFDWAREAPGILIWKAQKKPRVEILMATGNGELRFARRAKHC